MADIPPLKVSGILIQEDRWAAMQHEYGKLRAENERQRAALDMVYNAEGDHQICQCPVHQALRDAWIMAEQG